jgi:hypothetical protein
MSLDCIAAAKAARLCKLALGGSLDVAGTEWLDGQFARSEITQGLLKLLSAKTRQSSSSSIGDSGWLASVTGWSRRTITRLCNQRAIPGAFRAVKGKGSRWKFKKAVVEDWLNNSETKRPTGFR